MKTHFFSIIKLKPGMRKLLTCCFYSSCCGPTPFNGEKETGHGDQGGALPAPARQSRGQLIDRRRSGPYGEPERLYPRSVVRCVGHLSVSINIDERPY
jgi:hypothetical protein